MTRRLSRSSRVSPIQAVWRPFIDNVFPPALSNAAGLQQLLDDGIGRLLACRSIRRVGASAYNQRRPSSKPHERYAQHSVDEISRSTGRAESGDLVESGINRRAQPSGQIIAFANGRSGAGKTLVGLNIATKNATRRSILTQCS
jgi:hypothetical protein